MTKRVLVTGGAGFIGHAIIEYLLEKTDYEIVSLDRLDTSGTYQRINDIISRNDDWRKRVTIIWHDLKAPISGFIHSNIGKIDIVLHLAAGSHVDRSIDFPLEFLYDNCIGTANLLEYLRLYHRDHLETVLYFSTDEVFGPAPDGVFYKEWDRYNSGNPYSASKAAAEEVCLAYHNTYGLPILISHCMNVFGKRQHPEKFFPLIINKLLNSETISIHADAKKERSGSRFYIHTDDVAEAVLFLLKLHSEHKINSGDKFNITGSEEITNLELAQIISGYVGLPLKYEMVDFHSSRPGHDLRYALCHEKMKKLGWEAKPLKKRIEETIDWYLESKNKAWLGESK